MSLVDMQLSRQQSSNLMTLGDTDDDGGPKYPWGLSLSLDDEALAKLGISELPAVGSKLVLTAIVTVTSVRAEQTQNDTDKNVGLQITDMSLDVGRSDSDRANSLYGG